MAYHLPFLKGHLESDRPAGEIRKILQAVGTTLPFLPLGQWFLTTFQVQKKANKARQSDTKAIKVAIVALIPPMYLPRLAGGNVVAGLHLLLDVRNPGAIKSWRGWNNLVKARLLCPIDHLTEFDEDPER
jgi:hypothetical protein